MQRGDAAAATGIARALAAEVPDAADAQHILALCAAEQDDAPAAHAAFSRALALAPGNEMIALNFCGWLHRRGRVREALEVVTTVPETPQTLLQVGGIELRSGEPARARAAFERATAMQPQLALAWHGLGSALQALGELEAADAALKRANELAPDHAPAWINRAVVLRMLGRVAEAEACLRQARILGQDTPDVHNLLLGLLHDRGEPAQALAVARELVARAPGYVAGHESLSHLLWEHGEALAPGEDPFAALRDAAGQQHARLPMQLAYARALLEADRPGEALEWLQPLRAERSDPALDWLVADLLDRLDRLDEAASLYASVDRYLGDAYPAFLNSRARHAFRRGDPAIARDCAGRALRRDPRNQEAWALLGTAWRLAGDAREDWLFGYDRLVAEVEIACPPGFDSLAAFLNVLDTTLTGLHKASRQPRSQSVRGGTQTAGRLFGRDDPVIAAAEQALREAVDQWLTSLPRDASHPFLSRLRPGVRVVGSWSVRLREAGHHANHIHDEGWLSSAFYVALPASVRDAGDGDHAGWLQLGQPLESLGLGLPPRRLIRPRPGRLALFPSYLWHGTVPFTDPEPRLTIAFDVQPRG